MRYLTRKAHLAKVRTGEGKIRDVQMRERVVSSSLDVPMSHLTAVLNELTQGREVFE
jgi:hypothetical protein